MDAPNARRRGRAALLLLALLAPTGAGCGAPSHPVDGSPIVAPDSDAGRKALAESAELLKLRQRQEASRRRAIVAPEG